MIQHTTKDLHEKGFDIYNVKDPFYVEFYIPYSVNNSDMIRYDRIKDTHKGVQLCPNNCTYEGVNYTVNKGICNCEHKHREESNSNYINNKIQLLFSIDNKLYNATNIKVFKCYKNLLNTSNYIYNIGFWFGSCCLLVEIEI